MSERVTLAFAQALYERFNAAAASPPEGLQIVAFPQSSQARIMRYIDEDEEDDKDLRGRRFNLKAVPSDDNRGYEFAADRTLDGAEAGWSRVGLIYKDDAPVLEGFKLGYVEPSEISKGHLVTTYTLNKRGIVTYVAAHLFAGQSNASGFGIDPRLGQPKGTVQGREHVMVFDPHTGPVLKPILQPVG